MDYLNWQFECGYESYDGDRTGLPFFFIIIIIFSFSPKFASYFILLVNLCLTFYLFGLIEFVVCFLFFLQAPIVYR